MRVGDHAKCEKGGGVGTEKKGQVFSGGSFCTTFSNFPTRSKGLCILLRDEVAFIGKGKRMEQGGDGVILRLKMACSL